MSIIGHTTIYIGVKYFHPSQNIAWKSNFNIKSLRKSHSKQSKASSLSIYGAGMSSSSVKFMISWIRHIFCPIYLVLINPASSSCIICNKAGFILAAIVLSSNLQSKRSPVF